MPKIAREELEVALSDSRLQDRIDTLPRLIKPTPMGENEKRIVKAIRFNDRPMTRAEIAKSLGLKKSPYLINTIEGMVSRGILVKTPGAWRNGFLMYLYQVAGG